MDNFTSGDDVAVPALGSEMARARAVVLSLPDGPITDEDLARVGVTAEQYDRLMVEERVPEADRAPDAGSWLARNLPARVDDLGEEELDAIFSEGQVIEFPESWTRERDAGDELQDWIEAREDELEAVEGDETDFVLDLIDGVLAEENAYAALEKRMAECARTVHAVEDVVHRGDLADEDTERAERCARWNTEDAAAERLDDTSEGWDQ